MSHQENDAGTAVDAEQPPDQPARPAPDSFPCPRCATFNRPEDDFCRSCGLALEEARARAQAGAPLGEMDVDNPVGFGVRLLAFLVDDFIGGVISSVISTIVVALFWGPSSPDFEGLVMVINFLAVRPLYHAGSIAIWRTTAGKGLFGLYVVAANGDSIGFWRALGRSLGLILSAAILGIGYFMILFRKDNRALHDLICDTVVVKRRADEA